MGKVYDPFICMLVDNVPNRTRDSSKNNYEYKGHLIFEGANGWRIKWKKQKLVPTIFPTSKEAEEYIDFD